MCLDLGGALFTQTNVRVPLFVSANAQGWGDTERQRDLIFFTLHYCEETSTKRKKKHVGYMILLRCLLNICICKLITHFQQYLNYLNSKNRNDRIQLKYYSNIDFLFINQKNIEFI